MDLIVRRKTAVAEGIVSFVLAPNEDGAELPPFEAGAHIDVYAGEKVRQYSLCNPPGACSHYEIAVLREVNSRGGSVYMHDQVKEGDIVRVSEPRNLFHLKEFKHTVLLAGGIGITPIIAMAETLHAQGAASNCITTRDVKKEQRSKKDYKTPNIVKRYSSIRMTGPRIA